MNGWVLFFVLAWVTFLALGLVGLLKGNADSASPMLIAAGGAASLAALCWGKN